MSAKITKGLGRGFESLIPMDLMDESFDPTASQDEQISELRQIKLSQIVADADQPRRQFDQESLDDLAASIKEHGVLQPIVVMPKGNNYQIVAGERRFRASKMLGLDKIPALVRTLSGQHKLEISLIENLQRRDLNSIETATAYMKLRDQFNLTLEEIGARVGKKSVSAVSNTLRLLKLPKIVQTALAERKVSEGQVRPLIGLDKGLIKALLPKIIREEWSARKIEQYITDMKSDNKKDETQKSKVMESPYASEINRLKAKLLSDISVQSNSKGAGKIVIKFKDEKEFEKIKNILNN